MLDLNAQQMEWVVTDLGHTMNVEQLLLLADQGKVDQFHGKALDDIDFESEYIFAM